MGYLILQILLVLATFTTLVLSVTKIKTSDKEILVLMMAASFLYALGTMLIMLSDGDIGAATAAFKIQSTGYCFIGVLQIFFSSRFYRIHVPTWLSFPLLFSALFLYIVFMLYPYSTLMVESFSFVNIGSDGVPASLSPIKYEFGPIYHAGTLVMLVVPIVILVLTIIAVEKKVIRGAVMIPAAIIAPILPTVAKVVSVSGHFEKYDPNSLVVYFSCLVLIFIVQKHNLLDVVSIAHEGIIGTMDDVLIIVDKDMQLLDSNPAAKRQFPNVIEPVGTKETQDAKKFYSSIFESTEVREFAKDGRVFEIHGNEIFNLRREVVGYSALILDVTAKKERLDELINMRQKADTANSAKSDFLANMSHEIRTPMNAITGFAELCLQEKDYKYAQGIKTAASNMLGIINDILDISKIEAGKLELITSNYDTLTMLNDVISVVKVQLSKKHTVQLVTEIDPGLPKTLYGDELRLKQILTNLLSNAAKFTKDGYINFSVSDVGRTEEKITVKFRVKDTGIGMTPEGMSKLFMNFQQLDTKKNREIEGTGLGLSIAKSLVEMMNGSITVESVYEEGSTFTVMVEQRVASKKKISSVAAVSTESSVRMSIYAPDAKILIVDDNKVNLKVTQQLLNMYGIKADMAQSGREAIRMINTGYYDLVFMDHMMPELDGVDTTKLIRAQGDAYCRQLPIVALTANAVAGAKEMFLQFGLNDFISKPIEIRLLEEILEKWLPPQLYTYRERGGGESAAGSDRMDINNLLDISVSVETDKPQAHPSGIEIDGIDIQAGLKFYGGKIDAYMEVLRIFYETGGDIVKSIEQNSSNRKRFKDYTTEVHGLKSAAITVGALTLSEQAKLLEAAGKAEDYKTIQEQTPALLARYSELLKNIGQFLNLGGEETTAAADIQDKPDISKENLLDRINAALELFDDLEFKTARDILSELTNCSYRDENVMSVISECIRDIESFDYDKAEEQLKAIAIM